MTRDKESSHRPFLVNDEEMRILDRVIQEAKLGAEDKDISVLEHGLFVFAAFAGLGLFALLAAGAFKILSQ